ncbi:DUF2884 family protein [Arenimonas caeni]|jgi:hypothetical protein|uniref:DUF2884 family protein n=1 Tax=Arenimonas caeni TaxID=2058085 RepID=UPI002A37145E|nr:DUF2884 family protein [Arenimonas caeni]MDY0021377.1 DUF2884 family protein [Arenimonas caeni]
MKLIPALMIAPVLALAACTGGGQDESGRGLVDRVAQEVRDEIRNELANENISLGKGRDGAPRAEITPQGDLLIDGKTVPLDAAQREKLLAYRGEVAEVAVSGAEIGLQGAGLAKDAMKTAFGALVDGEGTAGVEQAVKEQAGELEARARALCDRLPALYEAQQALVEAVPEFAPYAEMDPSDIEKCGDNR